MRILVWTVSTCRETIALCALALLCLGASAGARARPSPDSIRRLVPAAFPVLPVSIRRDLETRRCRVPQPWGDQQVPRNVIHGSFTAARLDEWAVVCSVRDTSQILVYRVGVDRAAAPVDSLLRESDVGWMQGEGGDRWGYSRLIQVRSLGKIRAWRHDIDGHVIPQPVDHDAIEQPFVGKSAEAFYFAAGRWHRQITAD